MAKVFTVIVTYNGATWISKCINSLLNSTVKTNIIIVDNASTDNTLELIQPFFSELTLIRNTENKGFGEANNQGMLLAIHQQADFCFLLNQDAYVFKNTISLLVDSFKDPEYGIISPLQLNGKGDEIDDKLKSYIVNNYSEEVAIKILAEDESIHTAKPYPMRFVNAAAWMISGSCLMKTGLFHPAFYHYGEDNNYSSRVQYHGMKLGLLSTARVIHDRKDQQDLSENILLRKLKTIPLYTLLDIRKPLPIAYFLGFLKLRSLAKKFRNISNNENISPVITEQKRWFTKNFRKAKAIRHETKNTGFKLR